MAKETRIEWIKEFQITPKLKSKVGKHAHVSAAEAAQFVKEGKAKIAPLRTLIQRESDSKQGSAPEEKAKAKE